MTNPDFNKSFHTTFEGGMRRHLEPGIQRAKNVVMQKLLAEGGVYINKNVRNAKHSYQVFVEKFVEGLSYCVYTELGKYRSLFSDLRRLFSARQTLRPHLESVAREFLLNLDSLVDVEAISVENKAQFSKIAPEYVELFMKELFKKQETP